MPTRILIVEDDPDIAQLVARYLDKAGFTTERVTSGREALQTITERPPDLVVLDLMLPHMDGLEVCRLLRAHDATSGIPVIMLTAKAEEVDRIVGLEFGADDYVTKPFSPREMLLRIKAILRRGQSDGVEESMTRGSITIDSARHRVLVAGKPIVLTAVEFKLLSMLMQRPGRVQARDRLLNEVWGYESAIDTRTVDTHVRRLREKLGKAASAIETVRGFGYRLRE